MQYYPVTHNQADKGHFALYGLGHRWATDPGYANEHNPNGRGQTVGHSCVLIDGHGQALSGAGWGTNGTITRFTNNDRCGYALADCTEAYNHNNRDMPGAVVEHAHRHAMFVYPHDGTPAYAVVMDDVRKDELPHEFTWQMMFDDSMTATLGQGRAVLAPVDASGGAYVDTPLDANTARQGEDTKRGACVLDFEIREPGQYTVWARVRTLAPDRGQADSFYVQVDDDHRVAWHTLSNEAWTWTKVSSGAEREPVDYDLSAGRHRITLRMREPGTQVDCVLLTRDPQPVTSLHEVRTHPLFLEAEAGDLTAPMRPVKASEPDARLVVRLYAASELALSTDLFVPTDYRPPAVYPRLRTQTHAVNPWFVAVLLPLPTGTTEPTVSFDVTDRAPSVRIEWPAHTDMITWPKHDGSPMLLDTQ